MERGGTIGSPRPDAAMRVVALQFKQDVRHVETYDDFSCRGRNRVFGAKLSGEFGPKAVDARLVERALGGADDPDLLDEARRLDLDRQPGE